MYDLVVLNGNTYIDGRFQIVNLGISDGKFAAITSTDTFLSGKRVIDAKGQYVLPGGIDTHMHVRDPGHKERGTFVTESRAAAAGGCTTYIEHPISIPPQHNTSILKNRVDLASAGSTVDFCFFGAAGGQFVEDIAPLSDSGIVAFKTFLHQSPPGREKEFEGLTSANNEELFEIMKEIAKTNLFLAAHAEDNELITGAIRRMKKMGRLDNLAHCESRPILAEVESVAKLIRFGEETGCAIELVHISAAESMQLAKEAKKRGQKILLETCPHYLLLSEDDVARLGPFAKCNPPLRNREEQEKLWEYVLDGTVDFIGSDHSPFLLTEKEVGESDIFKATSGFPGVDLRLPLMINEAVKGRLTLERVVELLSVNAAKAFNIYPQKGAIAIGSDADLAIIDITKKMKVDWRNSYSHAKEIARVYESRELDCTIEYTVVRGKVVMEHGVVDENASGWGQFITPKFL